MPANTRNLRHATLTIKDAGVNTLLIPIMDGDLDFTIQKNIQRVMNRGRIDHKRDGDEVEMDIKFSFKFEQWSYSAGASTGVSPVDALTKAGGASAWVSTGASCGPYSVDLVYSIANPCNTSEHEVLTFTGFTVENINFKEGGDANTITVSGKAQITAPNRTYA